MARITSKDLTSLLFILTTCFSRNSDAFVTKPKTKVISATNGNISLTCELPANLNAREFSYNNCGPVVFRRFATFHTPLHLSSNDSSNDFDFSITPMTSDSERKSIEGSIFERITTIIGKSASTFVSLSFFLLLAYRRDALLLALFTGSILNSILGKILKKILNHERPAALQINDNVKLKPSDGGMPSSHAMSLGFIGTSILGGAVSPEYRLLVGVAMAVYSMIALRYRVRDHLHTADQIGVGLFLGIVNAMAWLKLGLGTGCAEAGPVLTWIQSNWVSAETGLFPYEALSVPIVVGLLVVGSFERRIGLWLKNKSTD